MPRQGIAMPYPHGYVDPLRTKGRMSHLASKLAKGERRARDLGANPQYWRGMLGVMNLHLKKKPHILGPDMAYGELLRDMVGLYGGKGKINLEEALKAWKR